MERDGLSGVDLVVLVVGGAVVAGLAVVWAGAALALLVTGDARVIPASRRSATAVGNLSAHLGDPAGAWPRPIARELPGPVVYWGCTALRGGRRHRTRGGPAPVVVAVPGGHDAAPAPRCGRQSEVCPGTGSPSPPHSRSRARALHRRCLRAAVGRDRGDPTPRRPPAGVSAPAG
ncbi:MAG: hypothetical protein U5R31_17030 [Acidimicrobiia bacterium]|nr:hypothetical protein [Acidimicrobiia bacterium]